MQPNAKAAIYQSIQITLFFQFVFLMLQLRAREFAPVTLEWSQPFHKARQPGKKPRGDRRSARAGRVT